MNLLFNIFGILLLSAVFLISLQSLNTIGLPTTLKMTNYLLLVALSIGILYCLTMIIAELIGFSQAHKKIDHKKKKANEEILRNKEKAKLKAELKSDISLLKKIWLYYDLHPVISIILLWLIFSIAFLLFMFLSF